jgi:hypothetical protein
LRRSRRATAATDHDREARRLNPDRVAAVEEAVQAEEEAVDNAAITAVRPAGPRPINCSIRPIRTTTAHSLVKSSDTSWRVIVRPRVHATITMAAATVDATGRYCFTAPAVTPLMK